MTMGSKYEYVELLFNCLSLLSGICALSSWLSPKTNTNIEGYQKQPGNP